MDVTSDASLTARWHCVACMVREGINNHGQTEKRANITIKWKPQVPHTRPKSENLDAHRGATEHLRNYALSVESYESVCCCSKHSILPVRKAFGETSCSSAKLIFLQLAWDWTFFRDKLTSVVGHSLTSVCCFDVRGKENVWNKSSGGCSLLQFVRFVAISCRPPHSTWILVLFWGWKQQLLRSCKEGKGREVHSHMADVWPRLTT